jgi:hypothetical protein
VSRRVRHERPLSPPLVRQHVARLAGEYQLAEEVVACLFARLFSAIAGGSIIRDHRDRVVRLETHAALIAGNVLERQARFAIARGHAEAQRSRLDQLTRDLHELAHDAAQPAVDGLLTNGDHADPAAASATSPQLSAPTAASENGASAGTP